MKVLCLSSGGIDSSLMTIMLQKESHQVFPLYINYGHKSARMELKSLQKVLRLFNLKPEIIDLQDISKISSGLTNLSISAIKEPFLPSRNLILLSIASAYAYSKDIRIIAMGLLDNTIFPDQTKEFVLRAESAISQSLGKSFKILTPMIDLDKKEIINLAKKYDFPLEMTYSCYVGNDIPCGKCMACIERANTY